MFQLPFDIQCGYFDCSIFAGLTFSPKRKVEKYEIEFHIENGLETYLDDKTYKIKKDHILIARPNQIRYSHLPFKTKYIKFSVEGEIAKKLEELPEYFLSHHPESILDELDEIIRLKEKNNNILLHSKILAFIHLVIIDAQTKVVMDSSIISAAKSYIKDNYHKKITLSDIAASVNLSETYFHTIFTEAVGQTPHNYLTNYRIEQAKKYLWDSRINMNDIAEKCGFCSQQHFSKTFKKETGMTPNHYRRSSQLKYFNIE